MRSHDDYRQKEDVRVALQPIYDVVSSFFRAQDPLWLMMNPCKERNPKIPWMPIFEPSQSLRLEKFLVIRLGFLSLL